jgi:hypothetical protein
VHSCCAGDTEISKTSYPRVCGCGTHNDEAQCVVWVVVLVLCWHLSMGLDLLLNCTVFGRSSAATVEAPVALAMRVCIVTTAATAASVGCVHDASMT